MVIKAMVSGCRPRGRPKFGYMDGGKQASGKINIHLRLSSDVILCELPRMAEDH